MFVWSRLMGLSDDEGRGQGHRGEICMYQDVCNVLNKIILSHARHLVTLFISLKWVVVVLKFFKKNDRSFL